MAGTPSSRGCDACREQKKKCDALKPACSRCARLQIPCVGAGQRRFMFKVQTTASRSKRPITGSEDHDQETGGSSVIPVGHPSSPPSNAMTLATGAFVSVLEVDDPRYDITGWTVFLNEIPRRMGTSDPLDASAKTFASTLSAVQSKQPQPVENLSQFGNALQTLRGSLIQDKDQIVDSLCAIYLILLCQGWLSESSGQTVIHINGIMHLLNGVSDKDWRGEFESQILVTVCMVVIFESIANPSIKLSPWLVNLKKTYYGPEKPWGVDDHRGIGTQTITVEHMVKIPGYFQEPELRLHDLQSSYHVAFSESKGLCAYVTAMAESITPKTNISSFRAYVRIQGVTSVLVSIGLLLGTILRIFEPSNELLKIDSAFLISEVVKIAARASGYRPLGAILIPLSLCTAWAVADDAGAEAEIERIIRDYETDFPDANWFDIAIWLRAKFEGLKQRRKQTQVPVHRETLLVDSGSEFIGRSPAPCCVM
ncbi:transcriptional regulator family: Fungal Specific TF [Trichoderma aggressivum f. europaeum]|uniref:Transcriptional regulator family: Fungal Specific TF n=1 Tax=Trichoderma aggressivum f. europaeum TaxID=173218 RepID=A0AAE1IEP2_9HYPO|nr:transcriptional regulator family: Fungal Specific TF [Trichoderma aggressivum f. europaeum]